jgi:MFS family permease
MQRLSSGHLDLWLAVAAMAGVQVVVMMAVFGVPVLAPVIAAELGYPPSAIGPLVGLMCAVAIGSSFWGGRAATRQGSFRVSQFCMITVAAAVLLTALGTPLALVAAALVLGLAFGPETPASAFLLGRLSPPQRMPLVFSLRQTGNQVGGMVASLALPLLVPLFGWRGALLGIAAVAITYLFILEVGRRHYEPAPPSPDAAIARATLKDSLALVVANPSLCRLALASLAFSMLQLSINSFLVSHAVIELRLDLVAAGQLMAMVQGAGLIGRVGWGLVGARWIAPGRLIALLGVAMSALAAALAVIPAGLPWPALALYGFALGLCGSGWNGVFLAEVARLAPPGRIGEATGGVLTFTFLGLVLGPLMFAAVVQTADSYGIAFAVLSAVSLAGVALLRQHRQDQRR